MDVHYQYRDLLSSQEVNHGFLITAPNGSGETSGNRSRFIVRNLGTGGVQGTGGR